MNNAKAPSSHCCSEKQTHCPYFDELMSLRRKIKDLSEQVRTDTLTGIYNYRFLLQSLELELERTRRSNQPTALIMIDLDHFKKINDSWGHHLGNDVLVHTANTLCNAVRKLDIPCRYGGEEFAVILPSTELLVGIQVAERIRQMIESQPYNGENTTISLTASFGVDTFTPQHDDTPESLIKRTDCYLYQAKKNGRNRVCHAINEQLKTDNNLSTEERDGLYGLLD